MLFGRGRFCSPAVRALLPLAACLVPFLLSAAGCTRAPAGPTAQQGSQTPDDLLSSALATLRSDSPNRSTYRSAVQQFNTYLDQKKELRDRLVLSDAERQLIRTQLALDLRDQRLEELERKSFTPLDAHHLDACLLFRDATRSLQTVLGPAPASPAERDRYHKELARLSFEWMVRQVQLEPRIRSVDDPRAAEIVRRFQELGADRLARLGVRDVNDALGRSFWPAHEVLRRGTGDAEERTRICLGLFEQLGLQAGVVTRTIEVQNEDRRELREVPWVVGVCLGKDIFLFDPVLGIPIAGSGGNGIATLRQARTDPQVLSAHYQALTNDPERHRFLTLCQYDSSVPVVATADQLAKPSLYLLSNLSALAPRMRELQGWLEDDGNHAVLYEDLAGRLKELRERGLDVEISPWRSRTGYPTVILAEFVEDPFNDLRRQALLAPRGAYIPSWVHELAAKLRDPDRAREIYLRFDNYVLRFRLEPGGVRDMLVRGRPELAVEKILESQEALNKSLDVLRETLSPESMSKAMRDEWGPAVARMVEQLNERRVQAQKAPPGSQQQLDLTALVQEDEKRFNAVWRENRLAMAYLTLHWSEPLVREHLTYFMALAKLELANRAELLAARNPLSARAASQLTPAQKWRSAEDWFERYQALTLPQARNEWGSAVKAHLATCRLAQQRLTTSKQP